MDDYIAQKLSRGVRSGYLRVVPESTIPEHHLVCGKTKVASKGRRKDSSFERGMVGKSGGDGN